MIRSMTAFSRVDETSKVGGISWEIRSVNHRYLDISLHLPEGFQSLENKFKSSIAEKLKRGKVEAKLRYQLKKDDIADTILVNESRVKALLAAQDKLTKLSEETLQLRVIDMLEWPGVVEQASLDFGQLFKPAANCLDSTVKELIANREREGEQLSKFVAKRCDEIDKIVANVQSRRKQVVTALREKITKRINDISADNKLDTDRNRLEQELVFHAQRLDVDEELDRLGAHLSEVKSVLEWEEPVGRRLDFLMQELNREANTLASKSNDAETTRSAVDLKVLIEQMREQVMNIE